MKQIPQKKLLEFQQALQNPFLKYEEKQFNSYAQYAGKLMQSEAEANKQKEVKKCIEKYGTV
jgi:hypothetical protein